MDYNIATNQTLWNESAHRKNTKFLEWVRLVCIVSLLLVTAKSVASDSNFCQKFSYQDICQKLIYPDNGPELGIYPEIKLGWRAYDYDAGGEKVFDVNFPSLKLSLFGIVNRFFAQGYYELSLGDGDGNVEPQWDGSGGSQNENLGPAVNFNRTDWAILLGYLIPHIWEEYGDLGIFAGYKNGTSEIDFKQYYDREQDQMKKFDYDLSSGGAFIGVGTGIKIGTYGIIGVRVAYSWLNIDVAQKTISDTNIYTGKGNGVSVGASWVGSLTQKLQYTVGVDWHGYNYENLVDSNNNEHINIDESQISVRIGVTYLFP